MKNSEILLPVVFQTKSGAQTEFEFEYMDKVLFSKIDKKYFFDDNKLELIKENPLIIYSFDGRFLPKRFIEYFKKNKNYILFHCSNEGLNHNTGYYSKAKVVLRSGGWDPNITRNTVFSVPFGFQSGFFNTEKEKLNLSKKDLAWSFFGAVKSNRIAMKTAIDKVSPNFHFATSGWNSADKKGPKEIAEYYKRSVFIPNPFGNIHFDCFRAMEGLEYGCIPVCVKFHGFETYKYIFGNHPFIIGKNWEAAAQKMQALMNDPVALRKKQTEVWEWYQKFKEDLSSDIKKIVEGNTKNLAGKQFYYQSKAKFNIPLRLMFFYIFTVRVYFNRFILRKYVPAAHQ
jgi:hypothetical protein